jgi:excisionase family DNA binding protein
MGLLNKQNTMDFIDVKSVVELTGLKKNTIYAYIKMQDLPSYHFGRFLRFKRDEVIDWMNSRITKNEQ